MVVEMWKNNSPQKQADFPTIPTTEKDWVINNWKNARLQKPHLFSHLLTT
jgi:hypothetical protein